MSTVDKIILAIVVLQAVISVFRKLMGAGGKTGAVAPVASADPARTLAGVDAQLRGLLPAIGDLQREGESLGGALRAVGGPAAILHHVLTDDLMPRLDDARTALETTLKILAEADDPAEVLRYIEQEAQISAHLGNLQWVEQAFAVLAAQARWRSDPNLREVLADADAISLAFLQPLLDFLSVHGLRFKEGTPISAPGPNMESVWFNLLPHHPVVQVPDDFDEDLLRWPAVAHEVAHIMFRDVPGLARELHAMLPGAYGAGPARIQGRSVHFDMEGAFGGWLEEIFADAVCMMLLGPSALRGMIAMFQAPDAPTDVLVAHLGPDGQRLDEHPPRHLRVILAAWFLERMGYLVGPEQLRARWERDHGEPTALYIPTTERTLVPMPLVRFRVFGQQLLERFYTSNYTALAGYPLSAITGLEMSPGLWARAKKESKKLLEGVPFMDDPRVVIAAAIEAATAQPGAHTRIAKGVRRAVAGIGTREYRVQDVHYDPLAKGSGGLGRADIRDAIILGALLQRPGRRAS